MNRIKVNGLINPLGYNFTYQNLRWENKSPKAKKITVVESLTNEIVLTKLIDEEVNQLNLGIETKPRTKYTCLFEEINGKQMGATSFETGKQDENYSSKWIGSNIKQPKFFTEFEVTSINQARLYIVVKGIYEVKINGQKITKEVLLPGYYSYDLWNQSNTFDVSDYLSIGKNSIEITITDGWYCGRLGFSGGAINHYGDQIQLTAELFQNKDELVLITNEQWKVASSSIQFSNIYDGEIQDYSIEKNDESSAFIVDNQMKIEDRMNNPIVKCERLKPKISSVDLNTYLLDFKQNLTGWIEFDAKMKYGQYLRYQVGEILQDGKFYRDNLRTAEARFEYISDGQERHVEPFGTFYGFRYALVETNANIDELELVASVIHSQMEELGSFKSDSQLINQLYSNVKWGQKGNFLDIPTDCPQRDERLGWTGDAQVFSVTAALNYDVENFFRNYLYNMRKEQEVNNGVIPLFIPSTRVNSHPLGDGVAAWSDAATIIPWNLYQIYQNKSLLLENYPLMRDWTEHLINLNKSKENKFLWQSEFQLGDWLSLDGKSEEVPTGGTDTTFIASIYFYLSVLYTAKATEVLNLGGANKYKEYADRIKAEIHNQYITRNGKLVVDTQTAYALIIEFDLYYENQFETIKSDFIQRLFDDHFKIKTGFVGTPIVLRALEKVGCSEVAVRMFENQSYPGWLYTVNLGATTIWERWNTVLADGSINNQGMNSLNHYAYGSVGNWMYKNLLGLSVDEHKKTITIKPNLFSSLKNLTGSVRTLNGDLAIKIENTGNKVNITINIPAGYRIENLLSGDQLVVGDNSITLEARNTEVNSLTILQACCDERIKAIIEKHMPIVFEDDKVKSNLEKNFINIRDIIVKKRMISEEQLDVVLREIKETI